MTDDARIIELGHWLQTAPGRYLLGWEQDRMDQAVADLFGFHALQLGLPALDALRANRMPSRWVAHLGDPGSMLDRNLADLSGGLPTPVSLHCLPEVLPFPDSSLDLVVMPHTLELAADPHHALAEVARVLRPEGRVVIAGFNPLSLWGARQRAGHWCQWVRPSSGPLFLPSEGEFIGYWRLRDWLRLLGMEIERGELGCYRPPLSSQRWLHRLGWMEGAGARWWPVLGAVYFVVAVKRVRGMRLVGLLKPERPKAQRAAAVVANRQGRS
jgi:SAM-dependent methyltransferase